MCWHYLLYTLSKCVYCSPIRYTGDCTIKTVYYIVLHRRASWLLTQILWIVNKHLLTNNLSLPIGLSEFWESEPIGTRKDINSIYDQGCRYHYLDNKRSKWGLPPTLTKTTWIFNFYCTAVFLKAIHPHLVWRFQNGITLDYTTSGSGRNKILSSSKPRPTSLKRTSWYLTPKCYTFLKSAGPGQFNGFDKISDTIEIKDVTCLQ